MVYVLWGVLIAFIFIFYYALLKAASLGDFISYKCHANNYICNNRCCASCKEKIECTTACYLNPKTCKASSINFWGD